MIDLVRQEEARKPLSIEYRVQDARDVDGAEKFDLVVAAYLLNYAETSEQPQAMCQAIARSRKPGGRFISVNNNPGESPETFALARKYGFVKGTAGALREGVPVSYTFFLDGGSFTITNYHLAIATHEQAFRAAGLGTVRWHRPHLSPEGKQVFGREFWPDFLEYTPVAFLECVRLLAAVPALWESRQLCPTQDGVDGPPGGQRAAQDEDLAHAGHAAVPAGLLGESWTQLVGPPEYSSSWFCPWCHEQAENQEWASLSVRPPKQRPDGTPHPIKFRCHRCGKWGDEQDLVAKLFPRWSKQRCREELANLWDAYEARYRRRVSPLGDGMGRSPRRRRRSAFAAIVAHFERLNAR